MFLEVTGEKMVAGSEGGGGGLFAPPSWILLTKLKDIKLFYLYYYCKTLLVTKWWEFKSDKKYFAT